MELNLDRLNNLRFTDFQEKQPSTTPTEPLLEGEEYKTAEQEHALKRQIEGLGSLQRKANQNKAKADRTLEVYRAYQENIKRSEQLQTDILKGVQAGENIYSLFLKAVQAISCMTSNTVFYSQLEGDIRAIYGVGLQEAPALQIELWQGQERYKKLLEALERESDGDSRERIKRAIKAHKNRIAELEALIKNGAESKAS